MKKMSAFESCTYMGGFCKVLGKCQIEGTIRNQMGDGKSWTDPDSERVRKKIAEFSAAARANNCPNQNNLQELIRRFQAGEPPDQEP